MYKEGTHLRITQCGINGKSIFFSARMYKDRILCETFGIPRLNLSRMMEDLGQITQQSMDRADHHSTRLSAGIYTGDLWSVRAKGGTKRGEFVRICTLETRLVDVECIAGLTLSLEHSSEGSLL